MRIGHGKGRRDLLPVLRRSLGRRLGVHLPGRGPGLRRGGGSARTGPAVTRLPRRAPAGLQGVPCRHRAESPGPPGNKPPRRRPVRGDIGRSWRSQGSSSSWSSWLSSSPICGGEVWGGRPLDHDALAAGRTGDFATVSLDDSCPADPLQTYPDPPSTSSSGTTSTTASKFSGP